LSRMVDDLVDVARFERGKVELRRDRLDLNRAILAALETSLPVARERSHEVVTEIAEEPLYVEADPVRLEQLLSNLILNACKFTPPHGRIVLRTHRNDDIACAEVQDNGIGMQPEHVETLFAPFAQGEHSLARSTGGLGIGLSIARSIAELHGGSLQAHSAGLGEGATFELELPLSVAPPPEATNGQGRPRVVETCRRVLIVEDNADIRESLSLVLGVWGHEVLLAATGDQGLAMAVEEQPDVALIDIGLPGMSGYDVARELRARGRKSPTGIRLIALTGYGQASDRQRAADAGFDAHLVKPVDPEVLRPLLDDCD
jgi:CheY-like chemotaxis protein